MEVASHPQSFTEAALLLGAQDVSVASLPFKVFELQLQAGRSCYSVTVASSPTTAFASIFNMASLDTTIFDAMADMIILGPTFLASSESAITGESPTFAQSPLTAFAAGPLPFVLAMSVPAYADASAPSSILEPGT